MLKSDIVIIGSGICGVSAAMAARSTGFAGGITLISEEECWPYERPLLSKWESGVPSIKEIFPAETYHKHAIDVLRGEKATKIDRTTSCVELSSGQVFGYEKLLIASGASARRLKQTDWNFPDTHYLRNAQDAKILSDSVQPDSNMLIIGGGFIGLELAASINPRTANVILIEAQKNLVSRAVPARIARLIKSLHQSHGVSIHTDCTISNADHQKVTLSNGLVINADQVIVGIGSAPNTELALQCGLTVDNGIVVDSKFSTEDPKIFAAGDCCVSPWDRYGSVRFESWMVAAEQGQRAGYSMVGAVLDPAEPPYFWSDQFDHSLQVVGFAEPRITEVLRSYGTAQIVFEIADDGHLAKATGFGPGNQTARDIKLAKRLIQAKTSVDPELLADPEVSLKKLLLKPAPQ